MPELNWNIQQWDEEYNWDLKGEEWSAAWGSSEAQWFATLYPRLHRRLPAARILEIAPGFGRWTRYLLNYCDEYTGIDLSADCVEACKQRFAKEEKAVFFQNDGLSLASASGQYNLVFSFDSLVHADTEVFDSYIPTILRLLKPDGVAFIHHSNLMDSGETKNSHNRSENVTAKYIRSLVENNNGYVLIQERINWGSKLLIDCLTTFTSFTHNNLSTVLLENYNFMDEAENCKCIVNQYCSELPRR